MNPIFRWSERRRVDRELSEEMAAHIEETVQRLIDVGQSEQQARMNARRQFGNTTLLRERSREAWGWNAMEQLAQDLRFGARMLVKARGFTAVAVIVLALGIGMNTAMFSTVKAVLLSALPYPDPGRLVELWQTNKSGHFMSVSWLDFKDWRSQNHSLQYLATYDGDQVSFAGDFTPRRVRIGVVSSGFFETMGTQAAIGRTFTRDEQKPGGAPTAILGYALSESIFGQAAQVIGKTVRMDGLAFTVIGVMPPRFDFPFRAEAWIPQEFFPDTTPRSAHNYEVVGRLKTGTSIRQAQADMNVIAARLGRAYVVDRGEGIRVLSLYDELVGSIRPALLILLAAVMFVLLIACVNISNLQMSRATARVKELALRSALGAGRSRLIRQLLTESILLATAGGSAGFLLAVVGTMILRHAVPANIPRIESIRVDTGVLLFTSAVSIVAGLLFGVLPAILGSRTNVSGPLKQGSGKSTVAPQLKRWGNVLVVGQIALSMVLLAGAALLIKSYWKLAHVNSGLKSSGVFVSDLSWPTIEGDAASGKEVARMSRQLLEGAAKLPGVQAAALVRPLPVRSSGSRRGDFEIQGRPLPADPHQNPNAWYCLATRDYFKVFALPILRGRAFDARDEQSQQQVAIVNQAFAREFFPSENTIGQRIRFFGFDRKPQFMTIIGVIPDVHAFGLNKPAAAEVFADYLQHAASSLDATLVVRGPVGDEPAIKSLIASINSDTPVEFKTMDDVIDTTISRERFQTFLLGLFAGFAFLLSGIGIYGLLSYTVTRRTSELGIRMALGADQRTVLTLVLREGGILVAGGLILGVICALFLTRTLSGLLFAVQASDPASFLAVALLFGTVAMVGCWLPARRASKIDPNVALRYE